MAQENHRSRAGRGPKGGGPMFGALSLGIGVGAFRSQPQFRAWGQSRCKPSLIPEVMAKQVGARGLRSGAKVIVRIDFSNLLPPPFVPDIKRQEMQIRRRSEQWANNGA